MSPLPAGRWGLWMCAVTRRRDITDRTRIIAWCLACDMACGRAPAALAETCDIDQREVAEAIAELRAAGVFGSRFWRREVDHVGEDVAMFVGDPEDYCEAITRKGRRCRNPMAYTQVHTWSADDGGWADDEIDRQCLVQRRCRTHIDRTIPPPRVWVQFVPCGRWES